MSTLNFAYTYNMVAFLAKPTESEGFEQVIDFLNAHTIKYTLTINPTIYTSCITQFWATAKVNTINGEVQLKALVDRKKVIITKAILRRDLQLEDAEESITMTRAEKKKYTFKETVISRLNLNDIEDMYMPKSQGKLKHLGGTIEYYIAQTLLVYMRIGCPRPFRVVYKGKGELKKFLRSNEVYKICDGTLIDVQDQLKNNLRLSRVEKFYKNLNRKWTKRDVNRSTTMLNKIDVVLKE
ncbi:hypothetical protein Tco_0921125 [Tanacetum coccineum]